MNRLFKWLYEWLRNRRHDEERARVNELMKDNPSMTLDEAFMLMRLEEL
jgi:hypothetical protein